MTIRLYDWMGLSSAQSAIGYEVLRISGAQARASPPGNFATGSSLLRAFNDGPICLLSRECGGIASTKLR